MGMGMTAKCESDYRTSRGWGIAWRILRRSQYPLVWITLLKTWMDGPILNTQVQMQALEFTLEKEKSS